MHNVFTPKIRHAKCRVSDVDIENIQKFYLSLAVSFQLPFKKLSNNYHLNCTLRAAYKEYVKQHFELKKRFLSFTVFAKHHPKNVKLQKFLPLNMCTCDMCTNFCLCRKSLIANGVQEISNKSTIAVCSSYCITENTQPIHHDMEVCDMLQFSRECIFQECKECLNGKKIIPHIKEANEKLNWEKACTWHKWKDVVKTVNGKLCKDFEQIFFTGTLEILLEEYGNHLLVMSTHLFHFEWQRTKFSKKLDNLVSGEVLFVIDTDMMVNRNQHIGIECKVLCTLLFPTTNVQLKAARQQLQMKYCISHQI